MLCNSETREANRMAALESLHVLDSTAEKEYDDLTRIAAQICGTPVSAIALIDVERQWFKSTVGIDVSETPREFSFCAHAIQNPEQVMVVGDATKDERFVDNPFVTASNGVRFYAGAPLVTTSGHAVGTLCVADWRPGAIDAAQIDMLQFLAQQVVCKLEIRAEALQEVHDF
ncbi:hypothetical protein BH11PSE13_BH11PSE13_41130 [soil metagenome]